MSLLFAGCDAVGAVDASAGVLVFGGVPRAPGCDVPIFVLFGVSPPGPVVAPGAPPLLAPSPLPA